MKKSILLLLPAMMALSACGNSGQGLSKGSVFNEEVMKKTFGKNTGYYVESRELEVNKKVSMSLGDNITGIAPAEDANHITSYAYWLVVSRTNASSEVEKNVYDIVNAKYLSTWKLAANFVDPVVKTAADSWFIAVEDSLNATNITRIYDQFGTILKEGEFAPNGAWAVQGTDMKNLDFEQRPNNEYKKFTISVPNDIASTFVYDVNGKSAEVSMDTDYDFLGTITSLKKYGHPELKRISSAIGSGNRYVVYDTKENKYVSSFFVPNGAYRYQVGDYFIYQNVVELEERATEYDFYAGGIKYDIDTHRINITNGVEENLDSNFILGGGVAKEVRDESDIVKYGYFNSVRLIRDDKALDPVSYGKILDEKLEEVADVTGIAFEGLKQFGENYIANNGIIYNAKLEEVAYITGKQELYNDSGRIFAVNGGVGLVNFEGKIIEPAVNKEIKELINGYYYVNDGVIPMIAKLENDQLEKVASLKDYENIVVSADGAYITFTKDAKNYFLDAYGKETKWADIAEGETPVYASTSTYSKLGLVRYLSIRFVKNAENKYSYYADLVTTHGAYRETANGEQA